MCVRCDSNTDKENEDCESKPSSAVRCIGERRPDAPQYCITIREYDQTGNHNIYKIAYLFNLVSKDDQTGRRLRIYIYLILYNSYSLFWGALPKYHCQSVLIWKLWIELWSTWQPNGRYHQHSSMLQEQV